MLSKLFVDLLQDLLKHRFRWFGYWLFLSEIAIALFFTVAALGTEAALSVPFGIYAALTFYQMRKFAAAKPVIEDRPKVSGGRSCIAALLSVAIFAALLIAAAFIADALGAL